MMRRVLAQVAADGTVDRRRLARVLDVSPALLDDLLAQLAAAGYVESFSLDPGRTPATCGSCPTRRGCRACEADTPRVWRLTAKGRRIAEGDDSTL